MAEAPRCGDSQANGRQGRLYSDADIERLRLLTRAALTGCVVGQLAALLAEQLAVLARDDAAPAPGELAPDATADQ